MDNIQQQLRNINKKEYMLVTYMKKEDIETTLNYIEDSLECYAYIYHDKDNKEPHWHVLLRFYNRIKASTCLNYFKNFTTNKANTMIKPVFNFEKSYLYLTHAEENPEEKHHYNDNELFTFGNFGDKQSIQSLQALEMFKDFCNNAPVEYMLATYGYQYLKNVKMLEHLQVIYNNQHKHNGIEDKFSQIELNETEKF